MYSKSNQFFQCVLVNLLCAGTVLGVRELTGRKTENQLVGPQGAQRLLGEAMGAWETATLGQLISNREEEIENHGESNTTLPHTPSVL